MTAERIDRLLMLSRLIRDTELARLAATTARRDANIELRDRLGQDAAIGSADAVSAGALYAVWVERRRVMLTATIDQQNGEVAAQLVGARRAFARAEALAKIRGQVS